MALQRRADLEAPLGNQVHIDMSARERFWQLQSTINSVSAVAPFYVLSKRYFDDNWVELSSKGKGKVREESDVKEKEKIREEPDAKGKEKATEESDVFAAVSPLSFVFRPHQIQALAWAREMEILVGGWLLGDDIGLGKTITTLGHIVMTFNRAVAGETFRLLLHPS